MSEGLLSGIRIVEVGGIGPVPFAGMLMADMGAEVIRVDVPSTAGTRPRFPILERGKRSIALDLKSAPGREILLRLIQDSHAVLEGFRPGVLERLGLGPEDCMARNPALVFARVTGWGQDGPLAQTPGHDINYLALSGVLHTMGTANQPAIPLNLIADFGAGGAMAAFGVMAALVNARTIGSGSVLDVSMVDGSALMLAMTYGFLAQGNWKDQRQANMLDGSAPFYSVYECSDGKHVALGALEPSFYGALLRSLHLQGDGDFVDQHDVSKWPRMRERLASIFMTRTRDAWARDLEQGDACVTPVLSLREAPVHHHNRARATFLQRDSVIEPQPAPRVDGRQMIPASPADTGRDTYAVLKSLGFGPDDLLDYAARGIIG